MTAGAGKTTQLLADVREALSKGKTLRELLIISFSKTTVEEVRDRLRPSLGFLTSEEWSVQSHNIRTLHSLCWAGLRADYSIISRTDLQEFTALYGWKLSAKYARVSEDDWTLGIKSVTHDDDLWIKLQRARLMRVSADSEAETEEDRPLLLKLHADYQAFKAERNLIDFTGMVEEGIKRRIVPEGISQVFVDEAQDMCKLFYEYHLMLYEVLGAEVDVTWYGDEDQSIYAFMGADPSIFVDHPARQVIYGENSHRMTRELAREAQDYISANKKRFPKKIVGQKAGPRSAHYNSLEAALDELWEVGQGKVLWLAITNAQLQDLKDELMRAGEPVLTSEGEKAARSLIETIRGGVRKLRLEDLRNLATANLAGRKLIPYQKKYFSKPYEMADQLERWITGRESLPFGGLSVTDERLAPWLRGILLTGEWERLLDEDQLAIATTFASAEPKPYHIELSTFHRAKGREADTVVICKDVSGKALKAILEDEEGGRRLGFVAMTRARRGNIFYRSGRRGVQDYWKATK